MAKTAAITVSKKAPAADLSGAYYVGKIVPDNEYETGGDELVNPASPALRLPEKIDFILLTNTSGGGYEAALVAGKIKVFKGGTEVAAKTDLSAQTFSFFALGAS